MRVEHAGTTGPVWLEGQRVVLVVSVSQSGLCGVTVNTSWHSLYQSAVVLSQAVKTQIGQQQR